MLVSAVHLFLRGTWPRQTLRPEVFPPLPPRCPTRRRRQGLLAALAATDDVEFLLPDDNDVRVEIRSASRRPGVPDGGRQERRLELIRSLLGWELLPVIRNRQRLFKIIESPWDSFGPTPPAGIEYGGRVFRDNGTPD
eukprot:352225-Chlamydomonas_euryale.AAC.5